MADRSLSSYRVKIPQLREHWRDIQNELHRADTSISSLLILKEFALVRAALIDCLDEFLSIRESANEAVELLDRAVKGLERGNVQ